MTSPTPPSPTVARSPSLSFHQASALVSNLPRRYRQYAGLALVIAVYLGGIGGWSCAVTNLERAAAPAPSSHLHSSDHLRLPHLHSPLPRTHAPPARPNIPHRPGYPPHSPRTQTVSKGGSVLAGEVPKE